MTQFISAGFHWYGFLIAFGMIAGMLCAYLAARYRGWNPDIAFDICIWAIPLAIVGARLNFVFWDVMAGNDYNFWSVIGFAGGADATVHDEFVGMEGLSIYGGLMGATLGIFCNSLVYKRQGRPETFLNMMDLGAPFMVLGQAIGRWGNYANGEVFGPEITNPAWQWFPVAVESGGRYYQAFFFYESMLNLLCCALCLWMLLGRRRSKKGAVVATYFMWYGIVRASMELFRSSEFIMEGALGLPTSFIMAIIEAVIGLIMILYIVYRARTQGVRVPLFVTRAQWPETGLGMFEWGRDPAEKLPPLFARKPRETELTEEEIAAAEREPGDEDAETLSEPVMPDPDAGLPPDDAPGSAKPAEASDAARDGLSGPDGEQNDDGFARKKFAGRD